MTDMLVKLYDIPPLETALERQRQGGVDVRRVLAPEKFIVLDWVERFFNKGWRSECDVSFMNQPPSCFIAVQNEQILGFACYDATAKGIFGPTGVDESQRGRGVGTALLLACLYDMRWQGYGYAVIGWAGPIEYYRKTVGAIEIEGSRPGIYRGMLTE